MLYNCWLYNWCTGLFLLWCTTILLLLNIGLYFLVFSSICSMYVLCVSNPAVAAKSNKPLLHMFIGSVALLFCRLKWRRPEFSLGVITHGVWGSEVPQKPKQFADIVYRFWLQKWSKFEIFAQFTSWFSTSRVCFMFHGGGGGLSGILGA